MKHETLWKIVGNQAAARVLLHIYHYQEVHVSEIAHAYGVAVTPLVAQLKRFEEAGLLVARKKGRTRYYSYNQASSFTGPLREVVRVAYDSIRSRDRRVIFKKWRSV